MRHLKKPETEHGRLKRMSAELSLKKPSPEGCDRKKGVRPTDKRELVTYVRLEHGLSLRRACHAFKYIRHV